MPIVRQMSELLLRGSLANVTMANLTTEEQRHVSNLVEEVATHPEMVRHKSRFIKELGDTIGADYSDDRAAAEEEFRIAIWRAVVSLFYHRKYTFECGACSTKTWKTKTRHIKPLDRMTPICPQCKSVKITDPGDTDLHADSYVRIDELERIHNGLSPAQTLASHKSPIFYIPGQKTYDDPQAIIDDDKQLVKFFGEFVWNYFRQILRENSRVEHRKTPQLVYGPADCIIVQEILSLVSKLKIEHNYCSRTQPEYGYFHVMMLGLQTPPEFSIEFAVIAERARGNGVTIECADSVIKVKTAPHAPKLEAYVVKPEHVLVLDSYSSESDNDEDGNTFTISQVSYRTVGVEKMEQNCQSATIDTHDVIEAVRNALPDGECQKIFDIWAGRGPAYLEFSDVYGDGRACINHIARFLGITTRTVNMHKDNIKVQMLAYGMVPN
jgi:hypothetical protein